MRTLDVARIGVRFGDRTVVDDVSFSLTTGSRVGIVGESGSGKTLTALSMIGLLPDNARMVGSVTLDGTPLPLDDDRRMSKVRGNTIAMVFQEPLTTLNPLMPIWRQIAIPLRLHCTLTRRDAHAHAVEWCARVGLPERAAHAYPHQLSGGQRQRVGIAIALSSSPAVIIADEPTSALDVTVQREILDLLQRLTAEAGAALLFISHDLAVVRAMTDEVIVMRHGKVVEHGPTGQVLSAPTSPYTIQLVESARASEATLRRVMGGV